MEKGFDIQEYQTAAGRAPFAEWLLGLKDKIAQARLRARLRRIASGNLGDYKAVMGCRGLFEFREHHGSGFRILFAFGDQATIVLLTGCLKCDQRQVLETACGYLHDLRDRGGTYVKGPNQNL